MGKEINNAGFRAALIAAIATVTFDVVQLLQVYAALRFPWDAILIYGSSLAIVIPFVIAMLALHYVTPRGKRFWTMGALIFTAIYAVFVSSNYAVQLATVIPAQVQGRDEEIRLLVQSPHSMFWVFDALGYIFMGIAMLMALPALDRKGRQKALWYAFLAHALVTPLIGFVYFYPVFNQRLYMIGYPWAITAPLAMAVLAFSFRRRADGTTAHSYPGNHVSERKWQVVSKSEL
jgi:hypothetical protein